MPDGDPPEVLDAVDPPQRGAWYIALRPGRVLQRLAAQPPHVAVAAFRGRPAPGVAADLCADHALVVGRTPALGPELPHRGHERDPNGAGGRDQSRHDAGLPDRPLPPHPDYGIAADRIADVSA